MLSMTNDMVFLYGVGYLCQLGSPALALDLPQHLNNINLGKEEGRDGCSEWWGFSAQLNTRHDGILLSQGRPQEVKEWNPCFSLLVCKTFTFCIKLSISQPMVFLMFLLLSLGFSQPLCWAKWESDFVGLSWQLGLNTDGTAELGASLKNRSRFSADKPAQNFLV